ncbi:hypothetical protein PoB_002369400 [Plakobranchus ocellatus]|uniref:Uncharacterized protein n=1 Tax=Plakobranchus ocellatus TaxID=259542 RepID=A0AAV3ZS04_9GAST|nr:hypothetical protein PoB_002369400 [Plakobranchus ocellatus]
MTAVCRPVASHVDPVPPVRNYPEIARGTDPSLSTISFTDWRRLGAWSMSKTVCKSGRGSPCGQCGPAGQLPGTLI